MDRSRRTTDRATELVTDQVTRAEPSLASTASAAAA